MSYECIIEDNIIIFKFSQGKLNPIAMDTLLGLEKAVDQANNDDHIKGIILTGAGRYFSGGFNLETFTTFADDQAIIDWFKAEEEVLYKLFTCSKPVIGAINGHATAAGMIVSMACDYRIVLNNPKIKLGMTEIKIGLSLTPAEMEIMRFGLDTDKNFRDVIFGGELFNPTVAIEKGVYDESVETEAELMEKAKAKLCAYIDTPGRPFIMLKQLQKKHAAKNIRNLLDEFSFDLLVDTFNNEQIVGTLRMVLAALSK